MKLYFYVFLTLYLSSFVESTRTDIYVVRTAIPIKSSCLSTDSPGLEAKLSINITKTGKFISTYIKSLIALQEIKNPPRSNRMKKILKQYGPTFEGLYRILGMYLEPKDGVIEKIDKNTSLIKGINPKVSIIEFLSDFDNFYSHIGGEITLRSSSYISERYCPAIEVYHIKKRNQILETIFPKNLRIGIWKKTSNSVDRKSFIPGHMKKGKKVPYTSHS